MKRYRLLKKKGEGTFSEVLAAQHVKTGELVAIKCMKSTFPSIEQVNNLREIQALRRLSPHPNIVNLREVLYDKPTGRLALVFELLSFNLYELIRGRKRFLDPGLVKIYAWQLLQAVAHCHRRGIFHRDIKPENVLLSPTVDVHEGLKLADLGSCRGIFSRKPYTEYISTRWYRAPECLLTDGYYGAPMDIWGVACVVFEVACLFPLFPGGDERDQLRRIHAVLGSPPPALLAKMRPHANAHIDFSSFGAERGSGLGSLAPHLDARLLDLLGRMLAYDPDRRISAEAALAHPFFDELRAAPPPPSHAANAGANANGTASSVAAGAAAATASGATQAAAGGGSSTLTGAMAAGAGSEGSKAMADGAGTGAQAQAQTHTQAQLRGAARARAAGAADTGNLSKRDGGTGAAVASTTSLATAGASGAAGGGAGGKHTKATAAAAEIYGAPPGRIGLNLKPQAGAPSQAASGAAASTSSLSAATAQAAGVNGRNAAAASTSTAALAAAASGTGGGGKAVSQAGRPVDSSSAAASSSTVTHPTAPAGPGRTAGAGGGGSIAMALRQAREKDDITSGAAAARALSSHASAVAGAAATATGAGSHGAGAASLSSPLRAVGHATGEALPLTFRAGGKAIGAGAGTGATSGSGAMPDAPDTLSAAMALHATGKSQSHGAVGATGTNVAGMGGNSGPGTSGPTTSATSATIAAARAAIAVPAGGPGPSVAAASVPRTHAPTLAATGTSSGNGGAAATAAATAGGAGAGAAAIQVVGIAGGSVSASVSHPGRDGVAVATMAPQATSSSLSAPGHGAREGYTLAHVLAGARSTVASSQHASSGSTEVQQVGSGNAAPAGSALRQLAPAATTTGAPRLRDASLPPLAGQRGGNPQVADGSGTTSSVLRQPAPPGAPAPHRGAAGHASIASAPGREGRMQLLQSIMRGGPPPPHAAASSSTAGPGASSGEGAGAAVGTGTRTGAVSGPALAAIPPASTLHAHPHSHGHHHHRIGQMGGPTPQLQPLRAVSNTAAPGPAHRDGAAGPGMKAAAGVGPSAVSSGAAGGKGLPGPAAQLAPVRGAAAVSGGADALSPRAFPAAVAATGAHRSETGAGGGVHGPRMLAPLAPLAPLSPARSLGAGAPGIVLTPSGLTSPVSPSARTGLSGPAATAALVSEREAARAAAAAAAAAVAALPSQPGRRSSGTSSGAPAVLTSSPPLSSLTFGGSTSGTASGAPSATTGPPLRVAGGSGAARVLNGPLAGSVRPGATSRVQPTFQQTASASAATG